MKIRRYLFAMTVLALSSPVNSDVQTVCVPATPLNKGSCIGLGTEPDAGIPSETHWRFVTPDEVINIKDAPKVPMALPGEPTIVPGNPCNEGSSNPTCDNDESGEDTQSGGTSPPLGSEPYSRESGAPHETGMGEEGGGLFGTLVGGLIKFVVSSYQSDADRREKEQEDKRQKLETQEADLSKQNERIREVADEFNKKYIENAPLGKHAEIIKKDQDQFGKEKKEIEEFFIAQPECVTQFDPANCHDPLKRNDSYRFRTPQNTPEGGMLKGVDSFVEHSRERINTQNSAYREQQLKILKYADGAVSAADDSFQKGNTKEGNEYLDIAISLADVAIGFVPGIGWGKDVYEAITGENLLTNANLSTFDRVSAILGAVSGGLGSEVLGVGKTVMMMGIIAKKGGNIASGAEAFSETEKISKAASGFGMNTIDRIIEYARSNPKWLAPGQAKLMIRNELDDEEFKFAEEILDYKNGILVGNIVKQGSGIDGFLNMVPISLKEIRPGTESEMLERVRRNAVGAKKKAKKAGFNGVDLYIKANKLERDSLDAYARRGRIVRIPTEGTTINKIEVMAKDGWLIYGP